MKVALVFPPLASANQPYSSLPVLTAFLKSRGHHQVSQFDANVEYMCAILTADAIRAAAEHIAEELHTSEADNPQLSMDRLKVLTSAALKAPIVAESIDRAVSDLRKPDTFHDLERLDRAKRLVHEALDIVSASCYPVSLSGTDGTDTAAFYTWSRLDRWARDCTANPFRSFFEERWLPKLLDVLPDVVGISITYESQLLAAVTLCTILKQRLPETPVVLGGQIVSSWYDSIEQFPEVFEWCDFLVVFEGESALETLLSALQSGEGLDRVPNLVRQQGGRVIRSPYTVEDINALPTPDYEGLPLEVYLAPETVFLLNTSRGCYWSKCNFCAVSPSMRGDHRTRHPDLVMRDIETITARHSSHCIMFGDDCVPPSTLSALASNQTLARAGISWQCEVRFENALSSELLEGIAKAGCRNLTFGLESYAPRVLSLMNKGVRHEEIRRILNDCRRLGIAFNLQLFFGFPGESDQEAGQTIDFVQEEMHGAATCSFGLFRLLRGSNVGRHPEDFGVHLIESTSDVLAERMEYEPLPEHAEESRQRLRSEMLRRTRYRYVAFSLDAHTLLFLHHAGVASLARDYYRPSELASKVRSQAEQATNLAQHLVRKPNQAIMDAPYKNGGADSSCRILVYDYDLDETIAVSRLAAWVLQQFDAPKPAGEPAVQAAEAAANPAEARQVRDIVNAVVSDLFARGLLTPGRTCSRRSDFPTRPMIGRTQ